MTTGEVTTNDGEWWQNNELYFNRLNNRSHAQYFAHHDLKRLDDIEIYLLEMKATSRPVST